MSITVHVVLKRIGVLALKRAGVVVDRSSLLLISH